jgi:hypothetical protein
MVLVYQKDGINDGVANGIDVRHRPEMVSDGRHCCRETAIDADPADCDHLGATK